MRFPTFWLAFLLLAGPLCAEELLSRAQRELRARKFYFGEIDGRASEETERALKKFQEARGIDHTGHLDDQTLRALGLPPPDRANQEEARLLEECCACVLRYWQARQSGAWERVMHFYAGKVDYLDDGPVDRALLESIHADEDQRWPGRKYTMLNRIASLMSGTRAQVTAKMHTETKGAPRRHTEDYIFWLKKEPGGWRISEMKLLE